jgi:hypothetical protein
MTCLHGNKNKGVEEGWRVCELPHKNKIKTKNKAKKKIITKKGYIQTSCHFASYKNRELLL